MSRRSDPLRLLPLSAVALIGFVICMWLIFAGCASSTLGKSLNAGVVGAAAADFVTTQQAIQSGRGFEANPLAGETAWQQAALKVGGIGLVMGLAHLEESHGHQVLAHVVRTIAVVAWSAVAVHNYRLAHR